MIFTDKQADGELTGYPSIDKPWLSYYSKEAAQAEVPDMNLYEYMYQQNSQNQNNTALDYFGKKISYAELFDNIDKVMHSFISLGVKKGDIVTFFALNTPECIYIIYALNRLGVMVNLEYLNLTEKNMQENIRNAKSEYVVTVDVCQDIVLQAVKEIDTVREVLIVPIFQSLPGLKKAVMSLKSIGKTRQRGMKYTDFIKRAKRLQGTPEKGLGKESALIIHSGGTTGVPKGVMLTNGETVRKLG